MSNVILKILFVLISNIHLIPVWAATQPLSLTLGNKENPTVLEHLQVLSSDEFLGRKFASEGSLKSQSYLVSILTALDVPAFQNKYRHHFERNSFFTSKQGTNIIAYIPGSLHINKYIVLSAHYDHLGTKGNDVYNGADDNASGTAALLHYANLLKHKPLSHSVIFLFTDGEEVDLLGAKAFILEQKKLLASIKLNINLDMIAGGKRTKKLRFISRNLSQVMSHKNLTGFAKLQEHLKNNSSTHLTTGFRNSRSTGSNIKRTNWLMASDHGVFNNAGIPFIYFGVGSHKHYHSEFDDFENINQDFYLTVIDIIFKQITYLDNAMSDSAMHLNNLIG